MASLTATLARIVFGPPPEVVCSAAVWDVGVAELRRRTRGSREAGAFLLGTQGRRRRVIEEFVFYDDIDPGALDTGIVVIDGRRLGDLWERCRRSGRRVVADVHVHPGGHGQSASDKANPIIAETGHVAIILPDFAASRSLPGTIGVYQYLGARQWSDFSRKRPSPLHVGWWPQWR